MGRLNKVLNVLCFLFVVGMTVVATVYRDAFGMILGVTATIYAVLGFLYERDIKDYKRELAVARMRNRRYGTSANATSTPPPFRPQRSAYSTGATTEETQDRDAEYYYGSP